MLTPTLIDAVDARTLLEAVQTDIHALGGADIARAFSERHRQRFNSEWLEAFEQKLTMFEPFKTVANSWIALPSCGGTVGALKSSAWAWDQLLAGASPADIIDSAVRSVEANRIEGWEVWPVSGILVSEVHDLPGGAKIAPNTILQRNWQFEQAFASSLNPGMGHTSNAAALLQRVIAEPVLFDSPDEQDLNNETKEQALRATFAKKMRLALGLASGGPVELHHTYVEVDPSCLLTCRGTAILQSRAPIGWLPPERPVDMTRVLTIFRQLEAMESPRALELSADRLLRSRLMRSIEDKIIDLGMALEIALMHDNNKRGRSNPEITNQISIRAAWLIGKNSNDRIKISRAAKEIYSARSEVIHTGIATEKFKNKISDFDTLVTGALLALLERSAFPNWQELVLGFDP